jgi:hypothetical protein
MKTFLLKTEDDRFAPFSRVLGGCIDTKRVHV